MNRAQTKLVKLGQEAPDMVFNQVWEVTCMTWPEAVPEKMDRSVTSFKKLHSDHVEQRLP